MGVINEYFLAGSDAAAADSIDTGPAGGVVGPDPGSELASLEDKILPTTTTTHSWWSK